MRNQITEYTEYLCSTANKTENTVVAYRRDLMKLAAYLDGQGIRQWSQVTKTDLTAYMFFLSRNGGSDAAIRRYTVSIKAFFEYLSQKGIVSGEPAAALKAPRKEKKIPEVLTVDEVVRLLTASDGSDPKSLRDRAMMELLYATGIKVSELVALKRSDVNLAMGYISCSMSANSRIIPFGSEAGRAVAQYLKDGRDKFLKKDTELLFINKRGGPMSRQGFWKLLKSYAEKADIHKDITPYTLRHSFAAHMIQNGADIKSVSELLGHSSIASSQVYAAFSDTKLREVYSRTHPRK